MERLGKELLRVERSVLSYFQMHHDDCPQLFPLFQFALNNVPSPKRKHMAPITSFTDLPSSTTVSTFLRSSNYQLVSFSETQLDSSLNVSQLIKYIDKHHPLVHHYRQKEL